MRWTSYSSGSHVFSLILAFSAPAVWRANAGEVIESRVDKQGDHYLLHIDMRIHADTTRVYRLLTDMPTCTASAGSSPNRK